MAPILPDELLLSLNDQFPCRELHIRTLATLLGSATASPRNIVIHGLAATGKSAIARNVLETLNVPHAIVNSRECITGRQLLEHTVAATASAIQEHYDTSHDEPTRCENLTALQVQLGNVLGSDKRLVLVFDGIDRQREAPPTLVPALARLGESIPNLTVVFIISVPSPRLYHTTGIPHLHFTPYSRDESIQILSLHPPKIFTEGWDPNIDYTEEDAAEDDAYVWGRFTGVVWDTLAKGAARDLISFRNICNKLWKPFTAPIVDGTFGTRDFARLMVSRRTIFQDESVLTHSVVRSIAPTTKDAPAKKAVLHELPYYSKYILCAAYLASFNPAKQDPIFFMKSHEKKRKKRATGAASGKQAKNRRIPRSMLAPSPFPLDRMLAILHGILPHKLPQSADLLAQIATLASLRLIVHAGAMSSSDSIDASSRWKINCGWEFIGAIARDVGFEIRDFVAGGQD